MHGGHLDIRFFPRKISEVKPIRVHFGPLIEGNLAHILVFFLNWNFCVTREIVDFWRNFGIFFRVSRPRYNCRNFIPDGLLGSPYSALEKQAPDPKIFGKFGKNFFGGGSPRGAWGQNLRGRPQMRRGAH